VALEFGKNPFACCGAFIPAVVRPHVGINKSRFENEIPSQNPSLLFAIPNGAPGRSRGQPLVQTRARRDDLETKKSRPACHNFVASRPGVGYLTPISDYSPVDEYGPLPTNVPLMSMLSMTTSRQRPPDLCQVLDPAQALCSYSIAGQESRRYL